MTNCLTSLPIELLDIILSYLSLTQLFHLSCTSTDLYKRVKHSDKIWKAAYFSRWRTYIICGETESKGMGSVDSMKRKMARSSLSLKWKSAYLSRAGSERAIGRGQTRIGHQAYGISEMVNPSTTRTAFEMEGLRILAIRQSTRESFGRWSRFEGLWKGTRDYHGKYGPSALYGWMFSRVCCPGLGCMFVFCSRFSEY